ncbi:hypothetical protein B566_EDAN015199 [Ephemera danica]|nr:hypothetical protein B566_EDAN015199 [Ephemera danica]
MVPVPQFPLYSGSMSEFDIHRIDYYLDEARDWALDISELERSITEARKCCNPRAIVVINPGNPTDREFHSFKKVMVELGAPYCDMELASFMSCSKGYTGENGLRSGYVEIINMDPEVRHMHAKAITSALLIVKMRRLLQAASMNRTLLKMGGGAYSAALRSGGGGGCIGTTNKTFISSVQLDLFPTKHYSTDMASTCKCLTLENMNPCIKVMEYAVRGPLVIRATEIEKELQSYVHLCY